MQRDKARDDRFFSCSNEHEINYVAGLYSDSMKVREFLRNGCNKGEIKYLTHAELYKLINRELKFDIPE
jgi:hypothetical protein